MAGRGDRGRPPCFDRIYRFICVQYTPRMHITDAPRARFLLTGGPATSEAPGSSLTNNLEIVLDVLDQIAFHATLPEGNDFETERQVYLRPFPSSRVESGFVVIPPLPLLPP